MHEIPTQFARLNAKYPLHLLSRQLTQLTHAPHFAHHIFDVLRRHARYAPQELLRGRVHARTHVRILLGPNRDRATRVWLRMIRFEVVEDVCRCVGRGRPDDAHARKVEREQDEFRLDRRRRAVRLGRCAGRLGRLFPRMFGIGLGHLRDGLCTWW